MSPAGTGRSPAPASEGSGSPLPREEPEFNPERDIPTEDSPEVPEDESVAGEEDPGAALDTARNGRTGG